MSGDGTRLAHGMPDADYRAAPGLSQSALKTILDCPARYLWELENPRVKDAYDFGHAVHAMVLGVGPQVERLDFPGRRTNDYKTAEREARATGAVPLLASKYDEARACADAIAQHPLAGPIFAAPGESEVAMFWTDPARGVECKGLADRVVQTGDGAHWIVDLKTTARSAAPGSFARDVAQFGYHVQAAFYSDGYEQITGVRPWFLNVVVESAAPYLVSVVQLDQEALDAGRVKYGDALDLHAACVASGDWPGYTEITAATLSLPKWAR